MEKDLHIDNLDELTQNEISSTDNGKCYRVNDDLVFKYVENPNEDIIKRLSKFYSTHFAFPRALVYENGKLIGYIREFVIGEMITNLPEFVSFEKYTNEMERIEREIEVLTKYKLRIVGLNRKNIIFDNEQGTRIIDTEGVFEENSSNNLYSSNMIAFSSNIMYPVFNMNETEFTNEKLNRYKQMVLEGKMNPSNLIHEINYELYGLGFDRVENLNDFKNQIKCLQK